MPSPWFAPLQLSCSANGRTIAIGDGSRIFVKHHNQTSWSGPLRTCKLHKTISALALDATDEVTAVVGGFIFTSLAAKTNTAGRQVGQHYDQPYDSTRAPPATHRLCHANMRCPAGFLRGSARHKSPNSINSVTSMGVGPSRHAPMNCGQ